MGPHAAPLPLNVCIVLPDISAVLSLLIYKFPKATKTKHSQTLTAPYKKAMFFLFRGNLHILQVLAVSFWIPNVQSTLKFKAGEWKIDLRLVLTW